MTVVLIISAIVLLLVVDFLILAGKLDFLMGRSLKFEMYCSLPRLRVIKAFSMILVTISLILLFACEPDSLTMKIRAALGALAAFGSILLGVLSNTWARKKGRANEMNPIFVSRMMQNEKYNVSRMGFLTVAWTLVAGIGYLAVYFFCNNTLFWKIYFAILVLVSVALFVLQYTWARKS